MPLPRNFAATAAWLLWLLAPLAFAQKEDYALGPGDVVRISVFKNPDMTTEARISEGGAITFPFLRAVNIGGLTVAQAEERIANLLATRGYVVQPQVSLLVLQFRSQQVSVLGQVHRPGRYPIETASRLSDLLAAAGGVMPNGANTVIVIRNRDGKAKRVEVNLSNLFERGDLALDIPVTDDDVIYVPREQLFYIYGQVQRPGAFRLEKNMTVMQALSMGGGLTPRGTERGMSVSRRGSDGKLQTSDIDLYDRLLADDVIYVREGLF